MFAIKLALAGLGPLVWHWGIGVGIIIIILAVEWFLGYLPFVQRIRKDLLWIAFAIAILLLGEWVGKRDADLRCAAKAEVIQSTVDQANTDANGNPLKDKFDEDNR